ncbi:PREDICTED: uncharacterized protein LOC101809563 [Ficedula albicollis]|uniref:uncharacterized protein LOC101809563 n=1 Tax=Ficedula albicollis TaxID=59894 RepID=UPI000359EE97|nr:PREDICTED: uncharacterized protein LOC101809563 [Ficedula albicollis]
MVRLCPQGGSFLMVPRVSIRPHDAHVPWSPQGPSPWFLSPHVPPVPLPHGAHCLRCPCLSPVASPCSHGPDIPMSLCPLSPPSPQRAYPQCSHSIRPCPHIVSPRPQAGLARCQREAEEVAELMRQNVARALEREGHLEQLQSRAQDLRKAGEAFTRTTQTVTRRQRRRHRRWHLVALGLGLLFLFILGLALALALARSSPGTVTSTVPTPQGGTKPPPSTAGTP